MKSLKKATVFELFFFMKVKYIHVLLKIETEYHKSYSPFSSFSNHPFNFGDTSVNFKENVYEENLNGFIKCYPCQRIVIHNNSGLLQFPAESALHVAMALVQASVSDDFLRLQISTFVDEVKKVKQKGRPTTWASFHMRNQGVLPFDKNAAPPLSKREAMFKWKHTRAELYRPLPRNRDADAITKLFGCPQPPAGDGAGCWDMDYCIRCDHKKELHMPQGIDKLPEDDCV